nr:hypothetical protein [Novosphingobium guangzhouense]
MAIQQRQRGITTETAKIDRRARTDVVPFLLGRSDVRARVLSATEILWDRTYDIAKIALARIQDVPLRQGDDRRGNRRTAQAATRHKDFRTVGPLVSFGTCRAFPDQDGLIALDEYQSGLLQKDVQGLIGCVIPLKRRCALVLHPVGAKDDLALRCSRNRLQRRAKVLFRQVVRLTRLHRMSGRHRQCKCADSCRRPQQTRSDVPHNAPRAS